MRTCHRKMVAPDVALLLAIVVANNCSSRKWSLKTSNGRSNWEISMNNVLFVCVHNAGRSQMAEAFYNRLAKGKGNAISAGTNPTSAVGPTVVKVMKEVDIDISGKKPRLLTPDLIDQANLVVTMGCGVEGVCPASWIDTQDWQLEDPKGKSIEKVREIRDEIRARVIELLNRIEI